MNLSKFGLLFVVFVDVVGQGLILPIINTLVMDPSVSFLPPATSESTRQFDFGLVIGIYYLSWFLGAVYISRLSDSIGRKYGILICLAGSLVGYVLTILALAMSSLWLLILGRAITGFTAGNQPIAQAAMADLSRDDAEKTKNLGYIVSAFSIGLVAGPLIAGLLSAKSILGDFASLSLPFYVAMVLVFVAIFLIVFFFDDKLESRVPLQIKPLEILLLLWKIAQHPTVLRISAVFFFYMFVWNTCIIFIDNYLTSRFHIGTFGTSMAMLVIGATLATSSAFLVSILGARVTKQTIVVGAAAVMAVTAFLVIATPWVAVVYVAVVPMAAAFAVGYATLLSIFSASVDSTEQGWVMGVSTALWTLGAGLTSLIGGELTGEDIHLPFVVAIGAAIVALVLIAIVWRYPAVRDITRRRSGPVQSKLERP